jgi:hypothetical protein
MSFRCHHDQVHIEIRSRRQDPLDRIALGDERIPRPARALGLGEFLGVGFRP